MADEQLDGVAAGSDPGTGKLQLRKTLYAIVDTAAKLDYYDHCCSPTQRDIACQLPSGRVVPVSRMGANSIHDSGRTEKAVPDGRPDEWRWRIPPFNSAETHSIAIKEIRR